MSEHGRGFERAVNELYPALARSAHVLCWSAQDVEDVVQETMLQALRGYASFQGRSSPLTWCYTILARVAAAANRQRRQGVPASYVGIQPGGLPPVDTAL